MCAGPGDVFDYEMAKKIEAAEEAETAEAEEEEKKK